MPRPPRIHQPQGLYHAVSRGVERRDIFRSDMDRHVFLAYLGEVLRDGGACLLTFCLMSNHYHLLIAIETTPLEVMMQRLLTRYALYFNGIYERVGHLFQGRYHATLCASDRQLVVTTAYIHMNPVRAGLTRHPSQWQWSGYGEFVGGVKRRLDLSRLAEVAGLTAVELRDAHAAAIEAYIESVKDEPSTSTRRDLGELLRLAAVRFGVSAEKLASGSRERILAPAKRLFVALASQSGYADSEIASILRCSRSGVSHLRGSK